MTASARRLLLAAVLAACALATVPAAESGNGSESEIVFARTDALEHYPQLYLLELGGSARKLGPDDGETALLGVSPDGQRLALALGRAGSYDLYVAGSDGGGLRMVAPNVSRSPVSWSPDARELAYETATTGTQSEVHRVRADGGGGRRLQRRAGAPAWSPDGTRIVVRRDGRVLVCGLDGRQRWSTPGREPRWSPDGSLLAVTRGSLEQPRILVFDRTGAMRASVAGALPAWSPDGSRLALVRSDASPAAGAGTFIFKLASGRLARVGPGGWALMWSRNGHLAIQSSNGAVWVLGRGARAAQRQFNGLLVGFSPDGRRLAAVRLTRSRQQELVVADARGDHPQRVVLARYGVDLRPTWAGAASLVYETLQRFADTDLYAVRPDGTGLRQLTDTIATDFDPDWSPDASMLVFSRSEDPFDTRESPRALWTLPAGGGEPARLTTPDDGSSDVDPDWSPDGSRIVFARRRGDNSELFSVGSDGRGLSRLGSAQQAGFPSWSPDGALIAFAQQGKLRVIEPDGSRLRTLLDAGNPDLRYPSWSPDGQLIAYHDGVSLSLASADGSDVRSVAVGHGPVAWSPDGTRLIYSSQPLGLPDAPLNLWSMALDGTDRRRVTDTPATDSAPDWRP